MKTVILAAGKGSRLMNRYLPKCLTPLFNGVPILGYQLSQLTRHFSIDDIYIVVGHRKELIMDTYPDVGFIFSPHYSKENTSKSLLRALKKFNEDILWLNGDVIFHPSVLDQMMHLKVNTMLVNQGLVGEEEVKYRMDTAKKINALSKMLGPAEGEALGVNYFKADSLETLRSHLKLCDDQDYFEKGIETAIASGLEVRGLVVDKDACTEIDFPADLERANSLLKSWAVPTGERMCF